MGQQLHSLQANKSETRETERMGQVVKVGGRRTEKANDVCTRTNVQGHVGKVEQRKNESDTNPPHYSCVGVCADTSPWNGFSVHRDKSASHSDWSKQPPGSPLEPAAEPVSTHTAAAAAATHKSRSQDELTQQEKKFPAHTRRSLRLCLTSKPM